ncbi:MAG TPA: 4Fe-4S dicluster domain-containing protein [Candidatus Polarisedimenticolia bacterium]|nr:4Fe-4S dicluster domain-containing protein [Candidatus Polarisedimenticolia bacterium]
MPGARAHGWVVINSEECKGCGLCISVCPGNCLSHSAGFNHQGYHPVRFAGEGCLADSHCFYACPEPGAIAVYRRDADEQPAA